MGIIIIILEIILGIFFIMTGLKILSGAMKQEFAKLGYPPIFNKITGLFELIGGIAMLVGIFYIPLAIFASNLLALTMLAGAGSLVFLGKDPIKKAIPAIVLFVLNLIILIYLLIV
ncbi:DoxX family protein [Staphylococcus saprophyticus]|nr:DoxX family protein [Staphylococcus saprophyticus]